MYDYLFYFYTETLLRVLCKFLKRNYLGKIGCEHIMKKKTGSVVAALGQIGDLKLEIKKLQKESQTQLQLENLTSDTLADFRSQINALQKAFSLLTDVTVEEIESIKKTNEDQEAIMEQRMISMSNKLEKMKINMHQLTNTVNSLVSTKRNILQTDAHDRLSTLEKKQKELEKNMQEMNLNNHDALEYIVEDVMKLKNRQDMESRLLEFKSEIENFKKQQKEELNKKSMESLESIFTKNKELLDETFSSIQINNMKELQDKIDLFDERRIKELKLVKKILKQKDNEMAAGLENYQESTILIKNEIHNMNFKIKVLEEMMTDIQTDMMENKTSRLAQEKKCCERFQKLKWALNESGLPVSSQIIRDKNINTRGKNSLEE